MSKESISHNPGAAGAEVFQSTGRVLQKIFQPDHESILTDMTDHDLSQSIGSSRNIQSHPLWKKLPRKVRKQIDNTINKNQNEMEKSSSPQEKKSQPTATFDYRKGYKIGVELKQVSGLSLEQLQSITGHILKAQPSDEYLKGLSKGIDFEKHAKQKEQLSELNNLSKGKEKHMEKGR